MSNMSSVLPSPSGAGGEGVRQHNLVKQANEFKADLMKHVPVNLVKMYQDMTAKLKAH
ncbi:hypothetical protein FOZ60_017023, partial [Perkinsus olseni]